MRCAARAPAALAFALMLLAPAAAHAGRASFIVDYPPAPEQFVIQLNRHPQIAPARRILSRAQPAAVHVMGVVVPRPTRWNKPWSFHLAPRSIQFFELAIEVCDAVVSYVEEHLDEVGGAFLRRAVVCPWGARRVAEIPGP